MDQAMASCAKGLAGVLAITASHDEVSKLGCAHYSRTNSLDHALCSHMPVPTFALLVQSHITPTLDCMVDRREKSV